MKRESRANDSKNVGSEKFDNCSINVSNSIFFWILFLLTVLKNERRVEIGDLYVARVTKRIFLDIFYSYLCIKKNK